VTPFLPTKLARVLAADGELQPLLAKTRELRTLAGVVHDFLSVELGAEIRVANFKEGKLALLAANAAAASKLRLLAPALTRFLLERRWQVSLVSIRVQPIAARAHPLERKKNVHLSTHALERLRALHERLPLSPARDALARLLRRHDALPRR
jgi:hypothetical protein